MLLLFKLSHFDATKGEWLKAEGEGIKPCLIYNAFTFQFSNNIAVDPKTIKIQSKFAKLSS